MTRSSLFAAAIALSLTATAAFAVDSEATFDKTLSVSGPPTLTLSTGSGYIHVTPGSDNQVHIIGHVHSHQADEDAIKQIVAAPPITQSGNTITVGATHSETGNITIDYDVTTPRSTTLTARSGSGDIQATGISGVLSANTGSGSIHLSVSGSADVKAQTGSGSIHIDGAASGLRAGTGSGSIEVTGNPTADWTLHTGSGSIRMKLGNSARFTLDASTGSGSVHVDQPMMMQGSINRHHVSGTVNGGGATVRAATGSGEIILNGSSTVSQLQENNSLHVPGATDCVDNPDAPACRKN